MKLKNRYNSYDHIHTFSWKGSMYVPFTFKGKRPKGGSILMWIDLKCAILGHVIFVSNTTKRSSIFISLIPDPVPFPDSGFLISMCFPVVGMHSVYLVVKQFRGCFKEKFWCYYHTFVSLRLAIYLPVLKSLVHSYEMSQMNRLWLTQIYLYRWYIPDLIHLMISL